MPTAPRKATDNRSFKGLTTQAEALAPSDLAKIVRNAIEANLDMDLFKRVKQQEDEARQKLKSRIHVY